MSVAVLIASSAVAGVERARAEDDRPGRETFVVAPFASSPKVRSLEYLELAAPALIAERLGRLAPLRFVGGGALFGETGAAPRWTVEGAIERQPDWKVAITVRLRRGTEAVASVTREGPVNEAAAASVAAALEAFARAGLAPMETPAWVTAPFGRDHYAFVLYGRALGVYLGSARRGRTADAAVELFKRSLVIDPRVPETRRMLGFVHLEAGRPGHARAMWAYAADERPTYVAALAGLAALDRSQGLPTARERYARLLELDPLDADARRVYGELLSEAGKLDAAQAQLEQVLALAPQDLRARRALALVLAARRAGAELVAELEQILKLDPEDVEARMDLGAAYTSIGKMAEAEAVYDEVLRRRPRHMAALKLAGDLARARRDLKKAAASYNKLRVLAPTDPRPVFLLAAAYFEAGDLDAASRLYADGARFPGMMGDAYSNLGAIALEQGRAREALWFLDRAVKRRPGKANARFNLAVALHGAGRHADALNELRTALRLEPADAGAWFFAGVVALRLGLLEEAERGFREALRLDPAHEDARHNLALLEPLVGPRRDDSLSFIEGPPAPAARTEAEAK